MFVIVARGGENGGAKRNVRAVERQAAAITVLRVVVRQRRDNEGMNQEKNHNAVHAVDDMRVSRNQCVRSRARRKLAC